MDTKRRRGDGENNENDESLPSNQTSHPPKRKKTTNAKNTRSKVISKSSTEDAIYVEEDAEQLQVTSQTCTEQSKDAKPKRGRPRNPNTAKNLKTRAESAEQQVEEWKNKATAIEKKYDDLHERSLAASDLGKAYYQDDQTISSNVSLLFTMIANWAADFAHKGYLNQHLSSDYVDIVLNSVDDLYPGLDNLPTLTREKLPWCPAGCQYICEALLSYLVVRKILMKPFHFSKALEHDVKELKKYMRDGSFDKLVFNSRVLRPIYHLEQFSGSITVPIVDDDFAQERENCYNAMSVSITNDTQLAQLLRCCEKEELSTCRNELLRILNAAGKVALQVWVQDCSIEFSLELPTGIDLYADMRAGRCVSRTTVTSKRTSQQPRNFRADWWLRIGLNMIRYETYGAAGISVPICHPTFVSIEEEKWQRNKDEYSNGGENTKSTSVPDTTTQMENNSNPTYDNVEQAENAQALFTQREHEQETSHDTVDVEMQTEEPKDSAETCSATSVAHEGIADATQSEDFSWGFGDTARGSEIQKNTAQVQPTGEMLNGEELRDNRPGACPEPSEATNDNTQADKSVKEENRILDQTSDSRKSSNESSKVEQKGETQGTQRREENQATARDTGEADENDNPRGLSNSWKFVITVPDSDCDEPGNL